ncbi:MAG: reactive intermediate/imine deaminase [Desulfobacteraceae bacterium 4572_89]|nr:MAG: reactive intermediate/imine deaminase [Desulfobacteraceae bacterium 4572_89]
MEIITATNAPAAIGPYSHAITHNGTIFCSGQLPFDPATMEIKGDTIEAQTEQAMKNVKIVLEAAGSSIDRIIKASIFLDNIGDFANMNKAYEAALGGHKPARSAYQVGHLPKDALVEIEVIAALG